jgi:hypothetical protein
MNLETIVKHAKRAAVAITFLGAVAYFGGGCNNDDEEPELDVTGPNVTCTIQNSYQGTHNVNADATDESRVQTACIRYRKIGSTGHWTEQQMTNTSGNVWTALIDFPPDELEYRVIATDILGNTSELTGTVRKYANEPNGDNKLATRLEQYKNEPGSEVLDYRINYTLDLGGILTHVDYWVLLENPSYPGDPEYGYVAAGWYQGESDGDHTAEKQLCDNYLVPWAQINACPRDEIPQRLDEIRANNWASGQVKAKSHEKEVF